MKLWKIQSGCFVSTMEEKYFSDLIYQIAACLHHLHYQTPVIVHLTPHPPSKRPHHHHHPTHGLHGSSHVGHVVIWVT